MKRSLFFSASQFWGKSVTDASSVLAMTLMALGFAGGALHAAQDGETIVFDNSVPVKDAGGSQVNYRSPLGLEFGDEITLAGFARDVVQFKVDPALVGNSFPNANFVIRFYKNDGADADPGPKVILGPGSLLWESAAQPISTGAGLVTLAVPGIKVPDSFTWTIQYANVNNTDAGGLVLGDPITIGKSFNDYWEKKEDGSWSTKIFPGGTLKANFVAQVTAVPEPATLALVAVGGGLLLALRRRR